jgi:ubiquinol-cytochrome c reductase subunit 7
MSGLLARVAKAYQKSVSKSLGQYGLKYDDALVDTAAVQEAMHWISKEDYTSRTRRIARATDCSMKRTYLPDEIQAIQKPLDGYLMEKAEIAEALADERAELTRW